MLWGQPDLGPAVGPATVTHVGPGNHSSPTWTPRIGTGVPATEPLARKQAWPRRQPALPEQNAQQSLLPLLVLVPCTSEAEGMSRAVGTCGPSSHPALRLLRAPFAVVCGVTSDKCLWVSGQDSGQGPSRCVLGLQWGSLQFLSEPCWFRLGQIGLFCLLKNVCSLGFVLFFSHSISALTLVP